jgi:hypothetical protein
VLALLSLHVAAQTTAFTYQGKLTDGGNPASGSYNLQFSLFDSPMVGSGSQIGGAIVKDPVEVSGGVFSVVLDFGAAVFGGADRYLEIGVKPSGSGAAYSFISPRQPITSSPYAIQTLNAQQLGGLPASQYVAKDGQGHVGLGTASLPNVQLNVDGTSGFGVNASCANGCTGVRGASGTGSGVYGETSAVSTIAAAGVYGKGLGSISPIGVAGEANSTFGVGVFGTSTSSSGYGMYARNTNGWAVYSEGHARQSRTHGGFVKAMALIAADGTVISCFNGVSGAAGANCGISVGNPPSFGVAYRITFDFDVNDRFILLQATTGPVHNCTYPVGVLLERNPEFYATPLNNQADVVIVCEFANAVPQQFFIYIF